MLLGRNAKNAYANTQINANAAVSNSFELNAMLHKRLDTELDVLAHAIETKDFEKKAKAAQKIIDILITLDASLDLELKEPLIENIHQLYEHSISSVFSASKDMDFERLAGVKKVLTDLKEGWEGLLEQVR